MSDIDIISDEELDTLLLGYKGRANSSVAHNLRLDTLRSIVVELKRLRAGRAAVKAEVREACVMVCTGWLASFEDGPEIQFTPARKYAADAVKDIRDALQALEVPNE